MYSPEEIRNIAFTQVGRNKYSADEVDDFVDACADTVERLMREKRALEQEKADMAAKLELLANKLVEYRQNEESISEALLSAQQTGRAIVREANQKAELILKDAKIKAENIHDVALREISDEEKMLRDMQKKVADFKAALLEMYREHLKLIDLLPEPPADPADDPADPAVTDADASDDAVPVDDIPAEPAVAADAAPVVAPVVDDTPADTAAVPVPADDDAPVVVPVGSQVVEPEETVDTTPGSRFANLQFGEDYDAAEPKRGLFGRKK